MSEENCSSCGADLRDPARLRYQVEIRVTAVHKPLALAKEPLKQDYRAEIAAVLAQLEQVAECEIQDQVHRQFRFLLCRDCQREYVENPLPEI